MSPTVAKLQFKWWMPKGLLIELAAIVHDVCADRRYQAERRTAASGVPLRFDRGLGCGEASNFLILACCPM